MDAHEWFSHKLDDLKEMVKKIDELSEQEDITGNYQSEWDLFVGFLKRTFQNDDMYRGFAVSAMLGDDSETIPIHEKIKTLFDDLTWYDGNMLKSIQYSYGTDVVNVEYNKEIEDDS